MGYRLPTEAEWEYATRADTAARYAGTDDASEVCRYGNVADAAARREGIGSAHFDCEDEHPRLAPVGSFLANDFGVHDMTGNVWEWVWDRYDPDHGSAAIDPTGPQSGRYRVARGGSFYDDPLLARVASRYYGEPSYSFPSLGFRVARSLP